MSAESRLSQKLAELGMELPPEPKGLYRPLVVAGPGPGHRVAGPG